MHQRIFTFIFIFIMTHAYNQNILNNIHKKWVVYNTENLSHTNGWQVVIDNYILDFEDDKNLKIKDIGIEEIESFTYIIESDTIFDSDKNKIYLIKELKDDLLILNDIRSNTIVYLYPLKENYLDINVEKITNNLLDGKWTKNETTITFLDKKYLIGDELETDYNIFYEENSQIKSKHIGFWQVDIYKNIFLIEIQSKKSNHKAIYQIIKVDNKALIAFSKDKYGRDILIEWMHTH